MGCCTSLPASEPVQNPTTVKPVPSPHSPATTSGNSGPRAASPQNTNAQQQNTNNNNRTVNVNGAKAAPQQQENPKAVDMKPTPNPRELKGPQRYEISPGVLGKGHFAVVKKCRDTITGQTYAVKIIDKKEMVKSSASVVKQEIEILRAVGAHPNIVQLIDHFEDATKHFLVMELCMGGDLFSQIVEHGKYSEQEAVRCCRQLADALKHIHSCGITHRDLKPENILLITASPDSPLKLADFGLSKLIKGHLHPMRTVCGTWAYCLAPETELKTMTPQGKMDKIRAENVTPATILIDEYYKPVKVKAIHTTPASREQLWTVSDSNGQLLFRCTADHKLSLLQRLTRTSQPTRVEIRCEEYFHMNTWEQARYQGYTASIEPINSHVTSFSADLKHIAHTFPIHIQPPSPNAPLEQYIGIEVDSATHRFILDSSIVTSNCAPEVIQRKPYDSSVDNWTLGVLMYILLSGYHPFDVYGEMPEPELLQKIITCSYDFDDPVWTNISPAAKDLIRGLLVLDPSKRLSLDYYLASPWINEGRGVSQANNAVVVERLSKFSVGKTKFRALIIAKLASNKFKASISKSKTRGASRGFDVPLLSNGEPDYLGLGSERNVAPSSARSRFNLDGLESVREGKAGNGALFQPTSARDRTNGGNGNNGNGRDESMSGSSHVRSGMLSVNQIDAVATTGRSERGHSIDGDNDSSPIHSEEAQRAARDELSHSRTPEADE